MKKSDFWGIAYISAVVALLIIFLDRFIWLTENYPYPMGSIKVALLATYGECLKTRRKTEVWLPNHLFQRFLVWGVYGILFTAVFSIFRNGVPAMISEGLWFSTAIAFSKSLWINACFAYAMMLSHEAFNKLIEKQGLPSSKEFKDGLPSDVWFSWKWYSIPATIVWFWIPMHTFTFSLNPHFQVLCAAFLSIALGFILTIKK